MHGLLQYYLKIDSGKFVMYTTNLKATTNITIQKVIADK